jgi:ribose transport system substrate-binding protein
MLIVAATSSTSFAGGGSPVQQAKQAIAGATKVPTWHGPTGTVPMSQLKGKTILVLAGNSAIPFVASTMSAAADAAKAAGMKTVRFDGKGTPSEWLRGIEQGVSRNVSGIVTCGVPPQVVKSALADAKKAHIPVVNAYDVGSPNAPLSPPGLSGFTTVEYKHDGALLGDYIVANANDQAPHILVIGDNEFPSVAAITGGAMAEAKRLLPKAKIVYKNVPVGQIATQLGNLTQTELRRDPKIKWVVAGYDAEALYIVPAIQQAGLGNSVKVVGHDAVPQNLTWVKQAKIQVFDVGDPTHWGGWSAIDALGRAILGKPQVKENVPSTGFTKASLQGKNPKNEDQLFGASYRTHYLKLWGLG